MAAAIAACLFLCTLLWGERPSTTRIVVATTAGIAGAVLA